MIRKFLRFAGFGLCLLLCAALPFSMRSVEQRLELMLDAAGQSRCDVRFVEGGETVTARGALLTLHTDHTAVITTDTGRQQVTRTNLVRGASPSSLLSRSTLHAVIATAVTCLLLIVLLLPLNAYLIQFSIEHSPDGRFYPFEAA